MFVQKLSHKNGFYLHENEPVDGTHFDVNGFEWRLDLNTEVKRNSQILYRKCYK